MNNPLAIIAQAPQTRESVDKAFSAFLANPSPETARKHARAVDVHTFAREAADRAFAAFVATRLGDLAAERVEARARKAAKLANYIAGARARLVAKRATMAHPTDAVEVHSTREHYLATLDGMARMWGPGVEPPRPRFAFDYIDATRERLTIARVRASL